MTFYFFYFKGIYYSLKHFITATLKHLSNNFTILSSHCWYLLIVFFPIQFEIFLVLSNTGDFLLEPGNWGYCVMKLITLILLYVIII